MKLLQRVLLTASIALLANTLLAQVIENPTTTCAFTVSANLTYPSCPGAQDGAIALTVNNADGTVDYEWIDDAIPSSNTDAFAEELLAGSYAIQISDGSGCADTVVVELIDPVPVEFELIPFEVLCAGELSGAIEVIPEESAVDLTYSIETGVTSQDSPIFDGLEAGTYFVTVEDANGCTYEQSATVLQPDSILVNLSKQDASCPATSDGIIEIEATGGTGLLKYSLNGINYSPNNVFTNLESGEYEVFTKDDNECIKVDFILIEEPEAPELLVNLDSVSCPGAADAQMIIIIESGVFMQEDYEFSIDGFNYQSDSIFTDLTPGEYEVYALDPNGCVKVDTVSIAPAPETDFDVEVDSVSCPGGADGQLIIIIESGVFFDGQYMYSLDGITFQEDSVFTDLTAGIYTIYVMDPNGCVFTTISEVEEPPAPLYTLDIQDATCNGVPDGTLTINVSSGSSPFDLIFGLDSLNYQEEPFFQSLSSGDHSAYVRNSEGCIFKSNFTVNEPPVIDCNLEFENETCSSGDGIASCNPTGGVGTYKYEWSTGSFNNSVESLSMGVYQVTVTDANNCEMVNSFYIQDEAAPQLRADITLPTCFEDENGFIELDVISEQSNFEYYWTTGSESRNIYELGIGEYSVTVGDDNDCMSTHTFVIEKPLPITVNGIANYQNNTGSISVAASGGTAPYSYSWSNGLTIANISGLEAGDYWVTIVDENGCTAEKMFSLEIPIDNDPQEIKVFPIPTMHDLIVKLNLPAEQMVGLRLFDTRGVLLKVATPRLVQSDQLKLDLKDLDAAVYWLQIELDNKVINRKVVKVTD